jgi:hypothetical protein
MFALLGPLPGGAGPGAPKFRWVSVGAVTATVLWLVASVGFSLYVSLFSSYGKTYGSLAVWWSCCSGCGSPGYVVLLGAEMNAEAEQQTGRDTTTGTKPLPRADAAPSRADSLRRRPGSWPAASHSLRLPRSFATPAPRHTATTGVFEASPRTVASHTIRAGHTRSTVVRTDVLWRRCGGTSCADRGRGGSATGTVAAAPRGAVTRTFDTPEFAVDDLPRGHLPSSAEQGARRSRMPFRWTVNPYRGMFDGPVSTASRGRARVPTSTSTAARTSTRRSW